MPHHKHTVGKRRRRELRRKRGTNRLSGWAKRQSAKH